MSWAKTSSEALTDFKGRTFGIASSSGEASDVIQDATAGAVSDLESLLTRYKEQIGKALETEEKAKRVTDRCLKEFQKAQSKLAKTPSTVAKKDANGTSSEPNPAYEQAKREAKTAKSKLDAAQNVLTECQRLIKTLRNEESDFQKLKRTIEEEGNRLQSALRSQAGFSDNVSGNLEKILRVLSEYESLSI